MTLTINVDRLIYLPNLRLPIVTAASQRRTVSTTVAVVDVAILSLT